LLYAVVLHIRMLRTMFCACTQRWLRL
jgi:hypothetical protein